MAFLGRRGRRGYVNADGVSAQAAADRLEDIGAVGNEGGSVQSHGAAWCTLHNCQMKRRDKNGHVWYSHKVGNTYCKSNGKK